jgi:hypothetical protein
MSVDVDREQASELARMVALEVAADPERLERFRSQEDAVLNGHCPAADPPDLIAQRLRDLDA